MPEYWCSDCCSDLAEAEVEYIDKVSPSVDVKFPAVDEESISDPGNDLFLMDFVGMLGIPVVPVSLFPSDSETVFLYTASAADSNLAEKTQAALARGANIVLTTGLITQGPLGAALAHLFCQDFFGGFTKIVFHGISM